MHEYYLKYQLLQEPDNQLFLLESFEYGQQCCLELNEQSGSAQAMPEFAD